MFGKLTIDAINDEVAHYGNIGDLDIIAIKKGTYDEFGRVGGIAKLAYGAIRVNNDAEVTTLLATPANKEDVVLTVENGGVIGTLIATSEEILEKLNDDGVNHSEVLILQTGESTIDDAIERTLSSVAYVLHDDESRTYYESFDYACNTAETGETVVVLRDYQYDANITTSLINIAAGKNVTIDLNGKIIQGTLDNFQSTSMITVSGTLTVLDNTGNYGALRFGSVYVQANPYTVCISPIKVNATGVVNVTSGKIISATEAYGSYGIDSAGTLNISGGVIESGYAAIRTTKGTATITGGEITGNFIGLFMQAGTVAASNAAFTAKGGQFYLCTDMGNTNVTISNCSLKVGSYHDNENTIIVEKNTNISNLSITLNGESVPVTSTADNVYIK